MAEKISNEEKKKRGTLQKCRVKETLSYDPCETIPPPAFKLKENAQEYYDRFCTILLSNKTLTIADVPIISRAAKWFEIYKLAEKDVEKNGAWQETSTGYTAKTGPFTVMADADDRITKIEALYGMNLTARTKINLPKPDTKNPFDNV